MVSGQRIKQILTIWWVPAVLIVALAVATSSGIVAYKRVHFQPQVAQAGLFSYECRQSQPTSQACEQQLYASITKQKGTKSAFSTLKQAYATDASVKANCHQLTHAIGRAAAEQAKNIEEAFTIGDNFCSSGYYHGATETAVKLVGKQQIDSKITTICAKLAKQRRYSLDHYNCVHGLGHGVMTITEGKLFDALKTCDRLNDSWEAASCHGGVFMENVMDGINAGEHTDYLKDGEPMYPCTAVEDKYREPCYLIQSSHALQVLGYDFAKVYPLCAEAGTHAATCYQSLGRDASGSTSSDLVKTKAICMQGPTADAQLNCIIGAVKDIIYYYHSDTQATGFCAILEPSLQQECTATKVEYYTSF